MDRASRCTASAEGWGPCARHPRAGAPRRMLRQLTLPRASKDNELLTAVSNRLAFPLLVMPSHYGLFCCLPCPSGPESLAMALLLTLINHFQLQFPLPSLTRSADFTFLCFLVCRRASCQEFIAPRPGPLSCVHVLLPLQSSTPSFRSARPHPPPSCILRRLTETQSCLPFRHSTLSPPLSSLTGRWRRQARFESRSCSLCFYSLVRPEMRVRVLNVILD